MDSFRFVEANFLFLKKPVLFGKNFGFYRVSGKVFVAKRIQYSNSISILVTLVTTLV